MKTGIMNTGIVSLLLSAVMLSSCIRVNFQDAGDDGLLPNEAVMSLSIDWGGLDSGESFPQECTVLMSRKVNTRHYVWNVGSDGHFLDGYGEMEQAVSEEDASKNKVVQNGEYYALVFNTDNSLYHYFGIDSFLEDESVSMKHIHAILPEMTDEEIEERTKGKIAEYNAYAPFIHPADEPLYLGINKNAEILHALQNVVQFVPKNLTMNLVFQVDVIPGTGVTIDNIEASVSGVPDRVQLMSGFVHPDDTYRVLVDMEKRYSAGSIDVYEGNVNVLGLFHSDNPNFTTGAGILHLTINASVEKDGERIEKVFNAGLNLYHNLIGNELMVVSEDKSGYTIAKPNAVIRAIPKLRINADQLVSEGGEGAPEWIDSDVVFDQEL